MNLRKPLCFLLIICTSCHKETPEEKKARRSFTKIGYSQLNLFVFSVKQTDSNNVFIRQDTVGLFCSDKLFDAVTKMTKTQWQFLTTDKAGSYILDSQRFRSYQEGTTCNDSVLFLHPARSCFKVLQHCPYPYFYNTNNEIWNWKFDVHAHWGVDGIYPIKEETTYDINYKLHDTVVKIKSGVGKLPCYKVTAESTSEFGNSYATYYLN